MPHRAVSVIDVATTCWASKEQNALHRARLKTGAPRMTPKHTSTLLLAACLSVACSTSPHDIIEKQDSKGDSPLEVFVNAAAPDPCRRLTPAAHARVGKTLGQLRDFDRLRARNYFPRLDPLPDPPLKPAEQPSQTTFAYVPTQREYELEIERYKAALRRSERQLAAYNAQFEKRWGQIKYPSDGLSELSTSAYYYDTAACHVDNITGTCSRYCASYNYDGTVLVMKDGYCTDGLGVWRYGCHVKAACVADPMLSNAKPGVQYSAGNYVIEFRYDGTDKKAMRKLQSSIEDIKRGDAFSTSIRGWRFNKTWIAQAEKDPGPLVFYRVACSGAPRSAAFPLAGSNP